MPDGLIGQTAGFDQTVGTFRIFDVWETREQATGSSMSN
jgi:hypothetical protein